MPKTPCQHCNASPAVLKRPRNNDRLCRPCFYHAFETEIHRTIVSERLFPADKRGQRVAIGASGGKDSTVLIHTLTLLNKRYDYGVEFILLSVDEGISGYRDDSLDTVKRNSTEYEVPLHIVSYRDLYNWTMDDIVKEIGKKNNCTFCGVFRRQALDRGAMQLGVDMIATGHNADDLAETVFLNLLRGDISRLQRCTSAITGESSSLPRIKPFKFTYEKEIVMYAYFKNLDYFSTECIYSPEAYRGYARAFLKDLELVRPSVILDIIHSGDTIAAQMQEVPGRSSSSPSSSSQDKQNRAAHRQQAAAGKCEKCGYMSSNRFCKACVLLSGLNRGLSKIAIGRKAGSIMTSGDDDKSK